MTSWFFGRFCPPEILFDLVSMAIIIERDVLIPMSDGNYLCADIYRPAETKCYPTIVERIPYLKETERFAVGARYFAEHGYAYVIQDVRGRGKSQGHFYPFFNEAQDGYDTLTWISKQIWSDNKVGTRGASYAAWAQWLCAPLTHPNLVTMVCEASPPDFFQQFPYQKGAFSLPMLSWLVQLDGNLDKSIEEIQWEAVWKSRPLKQMDSLCGHHLPAWRDWLTHDREDAYWKKLAFNQKMGRIKLPVFHITGWYDDSLIGSLINYMTMRRGKRRGKSWAWQKLLVGAWPHRVNTTTRFGNIDFGKEGLIDLLSEERKWFDHWLKEKSASPPEEPEVSFYVMGAEKWLHSSKWPPIASHAVKLYLHSSGHANTKRGDGKLTLVPPGSEPPDEYTYDPTDPVPFIMEAGWAQLGGPDDYSSVEEREDILVYSTDPFDKPLTLAGPILVRLFAVTSALDTDFTAKLLDARPDGYVMRLNDGIVRARYKTSCSHPALIVPGNMYEYEIDCAATSYRFLPGHSLRLEISSSAFPKYDPNFNSGRPIGDDKHHVRAHQRIYHNAEYASYVLVSVVENP